MISRSRMAGIAFGLAVCLYAGSGTSLNAQSVMGSSTGPGSLAEPGTVPPSAMSGPESGPFGTTETPFGAAQEPPTFTAPPGGPAPFAAGTPGYQGEQGTGFPGTTGSGFPGTTGGTTAGGAGAGTGTGSTFGGSGTGSFGLDTGGPSGR